MAEMTIRAWDNKGNKAEIEVTEFKTLQDAYKVIIELKQQVENLKNEIKKLKNGTSNG